MKVTAEKRLFWFVKEGTEFDLSKENDIDMYIQQILTRGRTSDVKNLLKIINPSDFVKSFERIKIFLPKEVRMFWEDWLEDINNPAKKAS